MLLKKSYFKTENFLKKAIKIMLLAGIIFMSANSQSFAAKINFEPFKMIFLSDNHVSFHYESLAPQDQKISGSCHIEYIPPNDGVMYRESFVILQDVAAKIKAMHDLSFLVLGGNLTNNDDKKLGDLYLYLDAIESQNYTYYPILGDREADLADGYTKDDFCGEFRRTTFDDPNSTYWAKFPEKNVMLIGLDTSVNNSFEGQIPQEELVWLDETLKNNPDKFTIITMHHPAFISAEQDKTVWQKYILKNSDEFLAVINKYPQAKLILSGHHHNYAVKNINNKIFISLPSVSAYPNNYKVLKIFPDKIQIENKNISYKQMIKKSKIIMANSDYAKEFNPQKPKKVLKFQKGAKIAKKKTFYFQDKK